VGLLDHVLAYIGLLLIEGGQEWLEVQKQKKATRESQMRESLELQAQVRLESLEVQAQVQVRLGSLEKQKQKATRLESLEEKEKAKA
jgi:hypothetical protein